MDLLIRGNPGPPSDNGSARLFIISIVFAVLASVAVAGRLASRLSLKKSLGLDDLAIIVSLAVSIAQSVVICLQSRTGIGKHRVDISHQSHVESLKLFWVFQCTYKITMYLTKASILLLYLRIFVITPFRRAAWTMLALVIAWGVGSTLAAIFQCRPIRCVYNTSTACHCISNTVVWYANGSFNIASDVVIWLMPLPVISSLQLSRRDKIGLILVFSIGGVVTIISMYRMSTLNVASKTPDPTWDVVKVILWSTVESNLAITCACLPMLKHTFAAILRPLLREQTPGAGGRPSFCKGSEENIIGLELSAPASPFVGNLPLKVRTRSNDYTMPKPSPCSLKDFKSDYEGRHQFAD